MICNNSKILNGRLNAVVGRQAKRPSQTANKDKWNFFKEKGLEVGDIPREGLHSTEPKEAREAISSLHGKLRENLTSSSSQRRDKHQCPPPPPML
ncbi:hypothetical protein D623_10033564 [Myotis brandtii]|uniref:Uncharacterized protein n=1 Tax=Myotis brandtii TaxID=109478 RepID=S7NVT7_MYOBR|nr:hypothetical protein D623_10033564 [Myotis brandtii]